MSSLTRIDISCTIEQKQKIQDLARKGCYTSVSAYIVAKATEEPIAPPHGEDFARDQGPDELSEHWLQREVPYSNKPPETLNRSLADFALETGELRPVLDCFGGTVTHYIRGGGLYKLISIRSGGKRAQLVKALSPVAYCALYQGWCTLARVPDICQEFDRVYRGNKELRRASDMYRLAHRFEWTHSPRIPISKQQKNDLETIQELILARIWAAEAGQPLPVGT